MAATKNPKPAPTKTTSNISNLLDAATGLEPEKTSLLTDSNAMRVVLLVALHNMGGSCV
jgi:hypothetical protein